MQMSGQMLQEEGHALVNDRLFYHLIIVQNEDDGSRIRLLAFQLMEKHGKTGGKRRWLGRLQLCHHVFPKVRCRLGQRRRAAISATQKRVGLLSSSSSESQATCVFCRCAQTESSVVLPQPAGAESRVSGVESASSRAVSKRSRSTRAFGSRGGASRLESSIIPCSVVVAGCCACKSERAVSSNRESLRLSVCPR